MAGTQVFTYCNWGKETTRGTPVAPTRQLYVDGTGVLDFDWGQNFHEAENAGVRTRIRRVTRTKEDVSLTVATPAGVSWDDLVIPFSFLKGSVTPTGAGADKTWNFAPSMTAANNPNSYSVDVGDDIQNWRVQYVMARSFRISAGLGDVTQLEMDCFGQRALKVAKASPAINSGVKIPSELWTVKFATSIAGLTGASVQTNFLRSFELEIMTGLPWRHYLDGNLYGAQHQETDIAATLTMEVESTALAVSEFYDKALADTLSFIRLKATGDVLGASNYSAQIDLPVLYEEPEVIAEEDEGVNLYSVVAHLAYDATSAASIAPVIVNSMTALP